MHFSVKCQIQPRRLYSECGDQQGRLTSIHSESGRKFAYQFPGDFCSSYLNICHSHCQLLHTQCGVRNTLSKGRMISQHQLSLFYGSRCGSLAHRMQTVSLSLPLVHIFTLRFRYVCETTMNSKLATNTLRYLLMFLCGILFGNDCDWFQEIETTQRSFSHCADS